MRLTLPILVAVCATCCAADTLPFWAPPPNVAALEAESRVSFAQAHAARDRLLAASGPRTVENTLAPFDEIFRYLSLAVGPANLLRNASPDVAMREASAKIIQDAGALRSEILLDPRVYQALVQLESRKGLFPEASYYLTKYLKAFRTSGVNQNDQTRAQIAATRAEIVKLQQQFSRNIVDGRAQIRFRAADLAGVPADYLRAHKPGDNGTILVSNDREDVEPITFYARNPEARRRALVFFSNRGYAANMETLAKLVEARHRLAVLCGFPDYVEMTMQDRMAANEAGQREFLDQADRASRDAAEAQKALLLEAKRRDDPSATALDYSDVQYYIRVIADQRYHFNEQEARPYFPYARVKESVFSAATEMFGIRFRPAAAPVWHPSVEAFDVLERDQVIGRIYLDMFPRAGKYQHFATFGIRPGEAGKQLPEGALICNFTAANGDDPGLMTPSMAVTFFHEFGHLLHSIFSGKQQWAGLSQPEFDFIEAPSQLLEEWYRNPKVLAGFARHYQTGQAIPADLVDRMVNAQHFGEALLTRRQLWLANLALAYDSSNGKIDLDAVSRDLYKKYVGGTSPDDLHPEASFDHLASAGYAGAYYTYQWSLAIAKDLFTQFDHSDLLNSKIAERYRETILNPGGSEPAAKLVEEFLGRPFNLKAYRDWLQTD